MKKVILAIFALAISTTLSFAQNTNKTENYAEPTSQQRADRAKMIESAKVEAQKEMERLDKELKLNDKQKQAIYGITMKMSVAKQSGNMDAAKIAEMKDAEFKYTLTAEQYQKYKTLSAVK
jgi:hypothetical protein